LLTAKRLRSPASATSFGLHRSRILRFTDRTLRRSPPWMHWSCPAPTFSPNARWRCCAAKIRIRAHAGTHPVTPALPTGGTSRRTVMPCLDSMKEILKLSMAWTENPQAKTWHAPGRGVGVVMVLALALLSMARSEAQTAATGAIAGTVTDATGAVVGNAKITVTSESTGDSRSGTSTSNGSFIVPLLPPGSYTVRASKDGFKELVHTGVTVHVTETAGVNFRLTVGALSEVVTVSSEPELLDTHDPALGKVTNQLIVSSLPLVARN